MNIRPRRNGPDFLCIGAQKAGTAWLYDQLRGHPDFWMPPIKELHYFDRDSRGFVLYRFARDEEAQNQMTPRKIARQRQQRTDARDIAFLDEFEKLSACSALDVAAYAKLFEGKEELLSGDITPGYALLPDELIAFLRCHLPEVKIVFLARDPVERAWSQLSMAVRNEAIPPFSPDDVAAVRAEVLRPEVLVRSFPTQTAARWRRHFPGEQVSVFLFDEIQARPDPTRRQVMTFLGADADKGSGALPADHNRKGSAVKLELSATARDILVEIFAEELRDCAAMFGGAAAGWPARYGL